MTKKFFTAFLALLIIVALIPVSAFAASSEPVVVIAGSDYQNTNGGLFSSGASTTAYAIMSQIKEDYPSAYGFLFGGDYYAHDTNTTTNSTNGKKQLKNEIVDVLYPDMADDTQIYIQGNHDADSLTTNGTLATSGAHDNEHYGVFVINEKDYMWYNNSQSTIKATASALESYLAQKQDEGYDKPIFVLSHLPLHYSKRTVNEGDGKYAKYIYDVLDEAGENGLNIIFMYGHNHSTSYYEAYLGNAAVYLKKGSTIYIANEGSQSSYFSDSLNFTYMNYGFVGYLSNSAADGALTMTVFEIYDDQVNVKRYDTSGLHNLKSAGTTANMPSGLSANTTVIGTGGATIELTAPAAKASFTDNGVTVTAIGITNVTAEKAESPSYNTALYSGYAEYTVSAAGYESGKSAAVSIVLADSDFDTTRSITLQFPDGDTKQLTAENGSVSFETKELGTFILMQAKRTGVEIPDSDPDSTDGTIWRQVSSFTDGKNYILVNYGNNASGVSEYAINSSAAPTAVNVQSDSEGAYIENTNMAIAWTAESNGSQFELVNADTGYYLYSSTYPSGTSGVNLSVASSVTSGTNYSNWSMESNSNTDSALSVRRATSSNYYPVRYSNGGSEFLAYTSTQTSKYDNWVAIFEQTSEGGSSDTVTPDAEDGWVSMPSGGTYVLDTDGIDTGAGSRYIIVGSSNNYALTLSNGSVGQAAVTIDGNTITVDDPSIYEFYFADNSSRESKTYLLTQDGNETIYHANGNLYYGSDNKGYWYIGSASNGAYQLYDTDNSKWYLNYGYVWSSESVSRFAVSSNSRTVRLYKSTSSVYEDTFLRLAGETEQNYVSADKADISTILDKIYIEVTNDGYYLSDVLDVTADMLTWDTAFDGTTSGTYTASVTYEGQNLGTITVTVTAEHSFETVTVDATCTEPGSITNTCTICGEQTVEVIEATGHSYDCVETEATCGKDGSKVYTCSACGDTYSESIPATGEHSIETVTVNPTCTTPGSVTSTCTVCGEKTVETIAATGHSYDCAVTEATCGKDGSKVYTCSACGDTYSESIPATGEHSYASATVDATCTEAGSVTYTCGACGHSYTDAIAALGHSYSAVVTAPTCTESGFTTYTCATCGHSYTDGITEALGHAYDSVITATCTEDGHVVYTCTTCGYSYNGEAVSAYGHSYETSVVDPTCATAGYTTYICTACGHTYTGDEVAALGHSYEASVTEATCTEAGFTTYKCSACGHSYTDDAVAALGHAYESVVTPPTFEEEGYTTHTCTRCGDVKIDSYVPVLSHTYETVTVEATCTVDGSVTHTCVDCGYSYTEILPAPGHSFETVKVDATCTENGSVTSTCTVCGHADVQVIPATGHAYETVKIDATCTENGYITYTCPCGHVVTEEIAALGHSYESSYTAPTCTEAGGTTYTCAVCGHSYTDVAAALGHSYESTSVAPTCTQAGYTTYKCSVCGDSYTADQTAALGHSYTDTVIDATCTENGSVTTTCTTCGDSSEKILSATGHSYSCTESDGYLVYTCDTCGHSYSEKIETLTYTKVSSLSSDNNYVITLYSGSKYYALSHEDNEISVVAVTVSNGEITSEITEDLVWTYSGSKLSYTDGSTTYYLYAKPASGWWAWFSTPTLTVSSSNSSTVSFSSSKLKVGSYYLRYSSSSVSLNRSATTTYLFLEE